MGGASRPSGYLLDALRSQCPIFFAVTGECGSGQCQTARLGSEHREHNGYHKGQHRTEQQIITDSKDRIGTPS